MSIQHKINKCDYYLKYDCKTKLNRNYCCYFFLKNYAFYHLFLKFSLLLPTGEIKWL